VLLAGAAADTLRDLPDGTVAARSAPYHQLFPRAAAIVHSGGIGTTAQALRAGRPQLVVPFAHDQFDNASRVERLGAGTWMKRGHRSAGNLAAALSRLLEDPAVLRQAERAAEVVRGEDGVARACDAVLSVMSRS
jgi:UDP:flavonoid glycosyltransferase YjiC (YdhE family)